MGWRAERGLGFFAGGFGVAGAFADFGESGVGFGGVVVGGECGLIAAFGLEEQTAIQLFPG